MPEIKNIFHKGIMNKDFDERLVPNGQFRDAMNIQVSTSEGSNVGSVQNILGNLQVGDDVSIGPGFKCVGAIADEKNDVLYWFITTDDNGGGMAVDAIIEYNHNGNAIPVLVDIYAKTSKAVLNFDRDKIITGINIIDSFLFWTDDSSEPKRINIDTLKLNAHTNLIVHSDMFVDGVSVGPIEERHVTVIRERPQKAPSVIYSNTPYHPVKEPFLENGINLHQAVVGSMIYWYHDRTAGLNILTDILPDIAPYSIGTPFIMSLTGNAGFLPYNYEVKLVKRNPGGNGFYNGSPGSMPITQGMWLNASGNQQNQDLSGWVKFEILEINQGYPDEDAAFKTTRSTEQEEVFEKEFVRFATRWKYADGEYSAYSPFTAPVFLAGQFYFHPTDDPFNHGMESRATSIILEDLVPFEMPKDVVQFDILFKKERSTTIYSIDSVKYDDTAPSDHWNTQSLRKILVLNGEANNVLPGKFTWPHSNFLPSAGIAVDYIAQLEAIQTSSFFDAPNPFLLGTYEITTENIYAALPDNQMLRPWDNVPRKALAQEITANRVVYANYLQNYNLKDIGGQPAAPWINVDKEERDIVKKDGTVGLHDFSRNIAAKSIKSLRTYYLGVVYGDKYGRETPVLTSKDASINIPYDFDLGIGFDGAAEKSLRLTASLQGNQPDWAHYFKYYIKQTTGEYYNLTLDRVYKAAGDANLWVSFPSSDRNKVQEGDYFILKKQVDIAAMIPRRNKIKIIDIKNEAPETIKYNFIAVGTASENAIQTLWPDISRHPSTGTRNLKMNVYEWVSTEGGASLESVMEPGDKLVLQFSIDDGGTIIRSQKYFVNGFSIDTTSSPTAPDGYYNFILKDEITSNDGWVESSTTILNAAQNLTTTIYKLTEKDPVEFEGRFFAKIVASPVTTLFLLPSIASSFNFYVTGTIQAFFLTENSEEYVGAPAAGFIGMASLPGAVGVEAIYNTEHSWSQNLTQISGNPSSVSYASPFGSGFGGAAGISNSTKRSKKQDWDEITEFDSSNTLGRGWFLDGLGFVASQTWGTDDPRFSGKMYKGLSGGPNGFALFNTVFTEPWKPWEYINGMEPMFSPNIIGAPGNLDIDGGPYATTGGGNAAGPRHWSSTVIGFLDQSNTLTQPNYQESQGDFDDSPYQAVDGGGHWMHLSFMAPGPDLHAGDWSVFDSELSSIEQNADGDAMHRVFFGDGDSGTGPIWGIFGGGWHQQGNGMIFDQIGPTNCWLDGYDNWDDDDWDFQSVSSGANQGNAIRSANGRTWWDIWNPGYLNPAGQSVVDQLQVGRKFVFTNDDAAIQYTIKKVDTVLLYNNIAWNPSFSYDVNGQITNIGTTPVGAWKNFNSISGEAWHNQSVALYIQRWWNMGLTHTTNTNNMKAAIEEFGRARNRRTCYILQLDKDPQQSNINELNNANTGTAVDFPESADPDDFQLIRFIDTYIEPGQNTLPVSPAIFETEAKENVDLNIYYEASDALPIGLDSDSKSLKGHLLGPVGCQVTCSVPNSSVDYSTPAVVFNMMQSIDFGLRVKAWEGDVVELIGPGLKTNPDVTVAAGSTLDDIPGWFDQTNIYENSLLYFWREDGSYATAKILAVTEISGNTAAGGFTNSYVTKLKLYPHTWEEKVGLPYYNCFSFGNGVESNRIRDDFNESFILNGVRASAVLEETYEEERRKHGLIYSGIYNSISGVNNLNQFIAAEKITKDLMPSYGSIQKLYARDKDLVTLCEDKIVRIYVDKDILYNADGNSQLLATNRVLGTAEPFRGNFGISKNPESFAAESFRAYFTDKQRGAVLRLSMDGLTPISDIGMHDFFRDNLKVSDKIIGSYDAYKGDYNLTLLREVQPTEIPD